MAVAFRPETKSDVPDGPSSNNKKKQAPAANMGGNKERQVTHEPPATSKDALKPLSGFTDYTEGQHYLFNQWKSKVETAYEKYGFNKFTPRPFELAENLMKGGIGHQVYGVYRLSDRMKSEQQGVAKENLEDESTRYALPYDRTVPLALFMAAKINEITLPYKRQHCEYSFRGEHAQAGRFRGFYQCDVDILDRSLNTMADYECLMAMIEALKALNVGPFVISLNHITIAKALIKEAKIPKEKERQVLTEIDKLDKNTPEQVAQNLMKVLPDFDEKVIQNLVKQFCFKGAPKDFPISKDASEEVQQAYKDLMDVYTKLLKSGVAPNSLQFCLGMVRGLDYYTGIVFESHITGKERFGSVASGGRYDDLVGAFNPKHKDIQGVGGSIGLTRLFHVLQVEPQVEIARKSTAQFLVGYRTAELQGKAVEIAAALRGQGINVDLYTNPNGKVKDQFKYAANKGIPNAIMVMDEKAFVLKDMASSTRADKGTEHQTVQAVISAAITQNKQQEILEQNRSGIQQIKGNVAEIAALKDQFFY